MGLYSALLVFYLLRRRRLCFDIDEVEFQRFCQAGEALLAGYLFHFLPFFFYDRTLFLHHYLPAYTFKLMISSFMVSHLHYLVSRMTGSNRLVAAVMRLLLLCWCSVSIYVFVRFSLLSYAHTAL